MFICNFKINQKKIVKFFIMVAAIIILAMLAVAISKVVSDVQVTSETETTTVSDEILTPDVAELTNENYTDVLKEVHENIDTYVGQKISFTGYVYRVDDLEDNQFVLARDMVINSKNQTVVVGFLCSCQNASDYENETWVKITGEITKGYYYGDIPIINITQIETCEEPADALVNPPSDSYVPTSVIY